MNILLVGGCTKKQAMRSHREKGEAKRTSERRRNPARRRNNCSGTVNCRGDKKYPRINPRRSPSLRLEYPFAYGLLRIEKFPAYRGTFFKYSNGSTASSCYTRDIASLRNPLFAEASPMRRSMFFTRNFRNCRFPDMPCFTEIRPCHTGYTNRCK